MYIDVRYHFIREKVENREIAVKYVPTECQRADIFTKALPKDLFKRMCTNLGLREKSTEYANGGSVEANFCTR